MQASESMALMKAWEQKGNPPCDHPKIEKEYYLGSSTGDFVCTTCGRQAPKHDWQE